jgi:hypothetical protein
MVGAFISKCVVDPVTNPSNPSGDTFFEIEKT